MAGRGPAPKPPEQRRRRNKPEGGEWLDLEPLKKPILPVAHKSWSARAKRMWKAWREDPVTQMYGPADLAAIFELAETYEDLPPNEQRLRMESLGLTPKGRQDRRWRIVLGQADVVELRPQNVRRLRVVAEDK